MLLDTSFLIDYFKGVQETRNLIAGEEVCTTVINYYEIIGWSEEYKSQKRGIVFPEIVLENKSARMRFKGR